ncbi:hypothetical protein Tco_1199355 [Tanacetum coccineum]
MDEDLRGSYHTLEERLFHEVRFVTPSFIEANNMLPSFQAIGLEPFLTLNEPIVLDFRFFGPKHDLVRNNITIPRTTQTQLQRDSNKLHIDDIRPDLRGWELFLSKRMFTFHERVMDPLDISWNPINEKGKRVTSRSATPSSSSSSDDNEAPFSLEFYEELSNNEDLTNAQ